jgi:hypothetical protein
VARIVGGSRGNFDLFLFGYKGSGENYTIQ